MGKEKILGYSLLALGLLVIAVATVLALRVLTGGTQPPKVFEFEAPTINLPQLAGGITEGIDLPEGFGASGQQSAPSSVKLLPDDVFNKLLNMVVFYLAMMFLASSGAKVAEVGIKLVKDIKVQIKDEQIKT